MKNLIILLLISTVMISFSIKSSRETAPEPVITDMTVTQVAIVVKDIDKACAEWASLLGIDIPGANTFEGHSSRPNRYRGELTDAKVKLAFLSMGNLQIELIQPLGGKSTWQEYLDKEGEGIHHIAFGVKGIEEVEKLFESRGMPVVQTGGWDGGAYSYIDASEKLGCVLELLENY